jgi:Leucine-rich repeat (LRR) protein
MWQQQWEAVLGRRDLSGLVLEAARKGFDPSPWRANQQATQAAHGLCLTSAACRQAVLGAVERVEAPDAWAREQAAALGAMTALVSLRLTGNQGVDPAQLPPLPRLTSLDCNLRPGAEAAAAWPVLSGLQQLALAWGNGGGLPPAVLQLPHLTCLKVWARSWDALRLVEQLTGLRALDIACRGESKEASGEEHWEDEDESDEDGEEGAFDLRLEHLCHLTSLSVECGSKHLPDGLGQLSSLRNLYVRKCSSLQQLPESLGQLAGLSRLDVGDCHNLLQLPESLGQLAVLRSLAMTWCHSLQHLPQSLGQLAALRSLDLTGCMRLQQLPESLGQLSGLSSLSLAVSSSLQQLPESLGQLSALHRLHMAGCSRLQQLPESLGQLLGLSSLDLGGCSSLQQLPESLGQLSALTSLDLQQCSSLQQLPESLGQLSGLSSLDLGGCSSLQQLPESLGQLSGLSSLSLAWCSSLQQLPESLGQLLALTSLSLQGCGSLLESLSQLVDATMDEVKLCKESGQAIRHPQVRGGGGCGRGQLATPSRASLEHQCPSSPATQVLQKLSRALGVTLKKK